jgi:hypothetical protein
MKRKIPVALLLLSSLTGCGQDQPVADQDKNFGGQLGDAYKGMLDDARQGAEDASAQMLRTERAVRALDE